MSPEDFEYYRARAHIERRYAIESSNPHAAQIHLKLAELYEKLVEIEQSQSANQNLHIGGGTSAAVA